MVSSSLSADAKVSHMTRVHALLLLLLPAILACTVASSPTRPYKEKRSRFDSPGFYTSNRYMSWILRPSGRMLTLPNSVSTVGISIILAIT